MVQESITILTVDNFPLAGILRIPKTSIKGVIQINSGAAIPKELYGNFASFLTENGYITLTYDYRGTCASQPKDLKNFKVRMTDWGTKDMAGALQYLTNRFPKEQKIVIGHSVGGQLIGLMPNYAQIDKIFLIASSTAYWRDIQNPIKWFINLQLIPVHIFIYGYLNSSKIGRGGNVPAGVATQWRKWSFDKNYFEKDLDDPDIQANYSKIRVPLKSIQIADDPIANNVTANKLLAYYVNTHQSVEKVVPKEFKVKQIGHVGYFSNQHKSTLWTRFVEDLN